MAGVSAMVVGVVVCVVGVGGKLCDNWSVLG